MKWYWKVRLYRPNGGYWYAQVITGENLEEINIIQDFYNDLTGCRMLLEGMSKNSHEDIPSLEKAFYALYPKLTV
jgi:hypothetical protein